MLLVFSAVEIERVERDVDGVWHHVLSSLCTCSANFVSLQPIDLNRSSEGWKFIKSVKSAMFSPHPSHNLAETSTIAIQL